MNSIQRTLDAAALAIHEGRATDRLRVLVVVTAVLLMGLSLIGGTSFARRAGPWGIIVDALFDLFSAWVILFLLAAVFLGDRLKKLRLEEEEEKRGTP